MGLFRWLKQSFKGEGKSPPEDAEAAEKDREPERAPIRS